MNLKINFDNPAIMAVTFIVASALVLVFIMYSFYQTWSKIYPELYKSVSKRIFPALPLIIGVPYWLFLCEPLYFYISTISRPIITNIGLGIVVGCIATSMYDIVIQVLLNKINIFIKKEVKK